MCGIVGVFNTGPLTNAKMTLASQSIRHRGPDSCGYWEDEKVSLGHRRLSIIDLSANANQPMKSSDGNAIIVFNGEIYNYLELKNKLESKGYSFQSDSDTEVALASYQEWGVRAFRDFNGIFSLAIFDRKANELILSRDHAGIKPLYYSFQGGSLIFCSEVRGFQAWDPNWERSPDWGVLFLTFGFIPGPYTTLKNVFSLSKGHYLTINTITGESKEEAYSQLPFEGLIDSEHSAVDLVRSTVVDAVSRNMISDAPLGVFLSGGVDSSLIALLAGSMRPKELTTLSVTFKESLFDESAYQSIVLDKIKPYEHISYNVGADDFLDGIDDIFNAMDQPSCDSVNSYFVSKAAHENGLKTVLSGVGADELFGGYPSFNRIDILKNISRLPSPMLRAMEYIPHEKLSRLFYLGIDSQYGEYLFLRGGMPPKLTSKVLKKEKEKIHSILSNLNLKGRPKTYDRNLAAFLESNVYMENQLLKDIDYMSMWHSLEVRVPFLDKELVSLMEAISPEVKFTSNAPKHLLLKSFSDIIPKEITNRRKQGFTFPIEVWLREHIDFFRPMLPDMPVTHKILRQFLEGRVHWSRVWMLIVYGRFHH